MSKAKWTIVTVLCVLMFTIRTSSQTPQPVQLVIDPVIQKDATTGEKFGSHNGPPDWRDKTVEDTNILDAADAANQACTN